MAAPELVPFGHHAPFADERARTAKGLCIGHPALQWLCHSQNGHHRCLYAVEKTRGATQLTDGSETNGTLFGMLISLTLVSGLVDALSYLGLGHVFTANMTGNVVLLGFAAAGAPGFSVVASLTSIGSFLLGAICAGRTSLRLASRRNWLLSAMAIEGVFAGGAAVVSAANSGAVGSGWARLG